MFTKSRRASITALSLILLAAAAAISMTLFMSADPVYANPDLAFDKTYIDMEVEMPEEGGDFMLHTSEGCTEKIKSAVSDDEDVVLASVSMLKRHVIFYPMGTGTTTVSVTGQEGTEIAITVYVSDAAFQTALDHWSRADDMTYGHPKFTVYSLPGVKVQVKVGKDKYKAFKIPRTGEVSVAKKLNANKRMYNVGTKITVKYSKDGAEVEKQFKVRTDAEVTYAKAKGKVLTLTCWDVHKGDKVKVTISGRSYTRKVGKNYGYKDCKLTFRTRKTIKKTASFKAVIKNKYKKTLSAQKIYIYNGKWDREDDILD